MNTDDYVDCTRNENLTSPVPDKYECYYCLKGVLSYTWKDCLYTTFLRYHPMKPFRDNSNIYFPHIAQCELNQYIHESSIDIFYRPYIFSPPPPISRLRIEQLHPITYTLSSPSLQTFSVPLHVMYMWPEDTKHVPCCTWYKVTTLREVDSPWQLLAPNYQAQHVKKGHFNSSKSLSLNFNLHLRLHKKKTSSRNRNELHKSIHSSTLNRSLWLRDLTSLTCQCALIYIYQEGTALLLLSASAPLVVFLLLSMFQIFARSHDFSRKSSTTPTARREGVISFISVWMGTCVPF